MNLELFELYVETQLAPNLQPGDVIILRAHPQNDVRGPLPEAASESQPPASGTPIET